MERDTAELVEITADDANGSEAGGDEEDVKEAIEKVQEGLRDAETKHGGC